MAVAGKESRQDNSSVELQAEQSRGAQNTATTRNWWSIDVHVGVQAISLVTPERAGLRSMSTWRKL
jgi:hypothetical protein